jgi:hypothetical protein
MKNKLIMLAVAGMVAASVSVSQAQPYYIVGDVINGWASPTAIQMNGGPTTYNYAVTGGTAGNYEQLKVTTATGWSGPQYPGNNLEVRLDATGGNTIYFYPGTFTDGWSPLNNRVGYADPGNMAWEITGDFTNPQWGNTVANGNNGTGSDPLAQMTLEAGSVGVYTNIYIVATPGAHNFKFRTPGTWGEVNFGSDFGNGGGNAVVITTTANQAVLFQLDLPNGRWQAGGPPAYCNVQFSVDMTLVAATAAGYDPTSVTVNGDALSPNDWGGTACTNNPTAANTNVFTSPYFSIAVGTSVNYQFRCISSGNTIYDALGGVSGVNRTVVVPNLTSTNIPTVYWDDALPTDLLNVDTIVTFSVSMTNAVGTDAVVFDPAADYVFINGDFLGWLAWNPITLASYQLDNNPPTSEIYTYTQTFPKGHSRSVTYKYAINGVDDEAGFAQNHFRYIRSSNGTYNMPLDTFGNQYQEPKVGLTIGSPSGGSVPITWFSYPTNSNVNLRSSPDLINWQDVPNTTGACSINWTMSSSSQFFRVVQQPTP